MKFATSLTGLMTATAVVMTVMGVSITAAPAHAADTLTMLKDQKFARIAIANEPPYTEVKTDGTVTGAAPEVARAVLKKLGVEDVVASISEYGAMIPGLQARRWDMVSAGLFIKAERCAAVSFSEPDLCDAEAFMLKNDATMKLESFEDVAKLGAKVGVPGGGTEEKLALAAGVARDHVIVVPDGQSGTKMLKDGRIDAYALPVASINDLLKKAEDATLTMYAPIKNTPIYCAGVAFRKQDTALRDAYDKELKAMKESGEFAKIIEPFGFSAEAAMATSREKLCGGPN